MSGQALAILLGYILALGIAIVLGGLIGRVSGWRELAEAFPCDGSCPKPRMWFGHLVFRNWLGYNGGVIVSADDKALHLSGWPLILAPTHAPISIPWSEIEEIKEEKRWFGRIFEVRLKRGPALQWGLRARTFAFAEPAAKAAGISVKRPG